MGYKNKLNHYVNGYLTVEASFLIPMILWLTILLISTTFFLYNRCLLAQDVYLMSFRGSVFTDWSEGYGEVIYGYPDKRNVDTIRENIGQRIMGLKEKQYFSGSYVGKYPFFEWGEEQVIIEEQNGRQSESELKVTVIVQGKAGFSVVYGKTIIAKAQASAYNPIAVIREARRRNRNAGD